MLLQKIRDYATSWLFYTIIGFLVVPFMGWGVSYYFDMSMPIDVAGVGDSRITLQEFQHAYHQQHQLGTRSKQEFLQQFINELILVQIARKNGVRIGDQQLRNVILGLPLFQERGEFNRRLYAQTVRIQGFTIPIFEQGLRYSLLAQQFREGIIDSALVTTIELDQIISLLKQQRELQYLVLPLDKYLGQVIVDDTSVKEYFDKNHRQFVHPQKVRIQFLELQMSKIAAGIEVSEGELKDSYQERITKYSSPERRQASHIFLKFPENASEEEVEQARARVQEIARAIQLRAKSFDQALQEAQADKSDQLEGGQLVTISRGMFDNTAIENALFSLKQPGDVSDIVQIPAGLYLLRLDGVDTSRTKQFEEVREIIGNELRLQKAENKFYELSRDLANKAYEHPDSLEIAAESINSPIQESSWFSRKGGDGIAANPKIIDKAFSEELLSDGLNSDLIELEHGNVVVFRIKEYQDTVPYSFEEARVEIVKILQHEKAHKILANDIETLKIRASQGVSLQTLATEFGGIFKNPGMLGRKGIELVEPAVLSAAFRLPQPTSGKVTLGSTVLANGDHVVLEIARVLQGRKDSMSDWERRSLIEQMVKHTGSSQFRGLLEGLRTRTNVVTYNDRI